MKSRVEEVDRRLILSKLCLEALLWQCVLISRWRPLLTAACVMSFMHLPTADAAVDAAGAAVVADATDAVKLYNVNDVSDGFG